MQTKETTTENTTHKKRLRGVVVGVSGTDTAKVRVHRYVKHPKYQKFEKKSKLYLVHDKGNAHKEGDRVVIEECKPISKTKRFQIV